MSACRHRGQCDCGLDMTIPDRYAEGYEQARRDIAERLTASGQRALVAVIADLLAVAPQDGAS
ncbi:MAG: hypothetical protein JWP11_2829 [Frankiales bacterium]|nr:hypothetical protein [Frankiales bacterium]